jgi:hypothetical protein
MQAAAGRGGQKAKTVGKGLRLQEYWEIVRSVLKRPAAIKRTAR